MPLPSTPRLMPDPASESWLVLYLDPPPPGTEPLVAHALRREGARALERAGDGLLAWFPAAGVHRPHLEERIRALLRTTAGGPEPRLAWRQVSREVWREHRARQAGPVRVTNRIMVAPPHQEPPAHSGIVLRIAPGAAFGDARHPTTRTALDLLEAQVRPGDRVLDVGTGSGILAMAAAHLGAAEVHAVDADPLACDEAHQNVALNGLEDRVQVTVRRLSADAPPASGRYHGVVVNLEGPVLLPLLPALGAALRSGGWLVLAGLLVPERDSAVRALADVRCAPAGERREGGWWSAAFTRVDAGPSS